MRYCGHTTYVRTTQADFGANVGVNDKSMWAELSYTLRVDVRVLARSVVSSTALLKAACSSEAGWHVSAHNLSLASRLSGSRLRRCSVVLNQLVTTSVRQS